VKGALVAAVALACCLAAARVAAEPPSVAVARFEAPGSLRRAADAAASRVARLVAARGARVHELAGGAAAADASAADLRRIALDAGVDAVLAGRAAGSDEVLELELVLRSGHSGGLLGRWSAQAPTPGAALEAGLASAADGIARALDDAAVPLADVAAPAPAAAPDEAAEGEQPESLLGSLPSDEPIAIESEQLDVVEVDGRRHLTFTDDVRVRQGDILLRTRKLDAFYAEGGSQPERLVATGAVEVVQGERVASCDRATYLRADQLVVCSGRATLTQGCDVVRGRRIEFDLEREHFRVTGAASVVLGRDEQEACAGAGETPS